MLGREVGELGMRRPIVLSGPRTARSPAHAICHAIGAVTGAAHGDANSVILPYAMRYNYTVAAQSISVARVIALQAELEVPVRPRDIGVPQEVLGGIAKKVMGERGLYFNPRPVLHPDEIESLLHAAW